MSLKPSSEDGVKNLVGDCRACDDCNRTYCFSNKNQCLVVEQTGNCTDRLNQKDEQLKHAKKICRDHNRAQI